jgi:hypothetical protein
MPQSLSSILIHLVFRTRYREPFITPAIEPELRTHMPTIFPELKSSSAAIAAWFEPGPAWPGCGDEGGRTL